MGIADVGCIGEDEDEDEDEDDDDDEGVCWTGGED
jgi:hypothetical protein